MNITANEIVERVRRGSAELTYDVGKNIFILVENGENTIVNAETVAEIELPMKSMPPRIKIPIRTETRNFSNPIQDWENLMRKQGISVTFEFPNFPYATYNPIVLTSRKPRGVTLVMAQDLSNYLNDNGWKTHVDFNAAIKEERW
jgi:hypothetical protein